MSVIDKIKMAGDLVMKNVNVPEWGVELTLRTMTSRERDEWEQAWLQYRKTVNGDAEDQTGFYAFFLTFVALDESGKLAFTQLDIPVLLGKSSRVLTRLAKAAMKLNGIGDAEVDDLLKN